MFFPSVNWLLWGAVQKKPTNPLLDANPCLSTETCRWRLRSHCWGTEQSALSDTVSKAFEQLFREQIICITTHPAGSFSAANDGVAPQHSKPSCERSFCFSPNINEYHPLHARMQVKDAVSSVAQGPISHKQRTAFSPSLSEAWQPYELDECREEGGGRYDCSILTA